MLKTISAGVDLSGYQIQATQMPFATVLRRPTTPENQAKCAEFVQDQARVMASLQRSPRRASVQRMQAAATKELCAGDELVVLIRGTTSAADWEYNLDMGMTYNSNYGQGTMHKGFVRLSDSLWEDGLREALDQAGSSVSAVTITGHSLGAAAASLLASRAQVRRARRMLGGRDGPCGQAVHAGGQHLLADHMFYSSTVHAVGAANLPVAATRQPYIQQQSLCTHAWLAG